MNGNGYLPPRVLQYAGLTLLFAFGVFWALTDRQSSLLVGAAVSLILLGAYGSAQKTLRQATTPDQSESPEEAKQ